MDQDYRSKLMTTHYGEKIMGRLGDTPHLLFAARQSHADTLGLPPETVSLKSMPTHVADRHPILMPTPYGKRRVVSARILSLPIRRGQGDCEPCMPYHPV